MENHLNKAIAEEKKAIDKLHAEQKEWSTKVDVPCSCDPFFLADNGIDFSYLLSRGSCFSKQMIAEEKLKVRDALNELRENIKRLQSQTQALKTLKVRCRSNTLFLHCTSLSVTIRLVWRMPFRDTWVKLVSLSCRWHCKTNNPSV